MAEAICQMTSVEMPHRKILLNDQFVTLRQGCSMPNFTAFVVVFPSPWLMQAKMLMGSKLCRFLMYTSLISAGSTMSI